VDIGDRPVSLSRRAVIGVAGVAALAAGRLATPEDEPAHRATQSTVRDSDYDSLEAALAATPRAGVLEVVQRHIRDSEFVVDKAVTVRFRQAGEIVVTSPEVAGIVIASDDIRLEDPVLTGTGGDSAGLGDGIRGAARAAQPFVGLQIIRPRISEFSMSGIRLEHVYGFVIADVDISRCAYAGVLLLSAINGSVMRGTVRDILQPDGFVNSYGIAVTRSTLGNIETVSPRSRDVTVEGVTVDGVTKWEGLDTHAGENIIFRGNVVRRAHRGIAVIGSKGEPAGPTGTVHAPLNCVVADNVVSFGRADGTGERGLVFAGAADGVSTVRELATGRVTGNTICDYGTEGSVNGAALQLYGTVGVSVSDNTVIRPGYCGIDFNHSNYGVKAIGNTVVDVWSNGQPKPVAVKLHSVDNKLVISCTTIVRSSKEATHVNERGLSVSSSTRNTVLDGGGDDWSAATVSLVDNITATRESGGVQKLGFFGADPVSQPAAIRPPAANPAALKRSVDGILSLLADLGLMSEGL